MRRRARLLPSRDPEQPEQSHDVIDAQAAGVAQARANRLHERLVAGTAQPGRHERRQAPVLPLRVELVGRRADAHAAREDILKCPSVGSSGIEADRQILHDRHGRRRPRELPIDQILQPLVKDDARSRIVRIAARRATAGDRRMPVLGRPLPEAGAESLGQHAEGRELVQAWLLPLKLVEPVVARSRTSFQIVSRARDLSLKIASRSISRSRLSRRAACGQVAHNSMSRAPSTSSIRRYSGLRNRRLEGKYGLGCCGRVGAGGGQRIDQRDAGTLLGRPAAQPAQIGEIADAPALARARRIELNRPAPGREMPPADDMSPARRSAAPACRAGRPIS